jgi:hypothetical protein
MKNIYEEGEGLANNVGDGNIASVGVPNVSKPANWGEPGISKSAQRKHRGSILRRNPPQALKEEPKTDYRGEHEAPGPGSGAPLHDTTGVYPEDFYGPKGFRYYATDPDSNSDRRSYNAAVSLRGNPDAKVAVHRAVPKSVYKEALKSDAPHEKLFRKGDWVTPSKEYAKEHGEANLGGDYMIASKRVKARDVYTDGNSIHEWGYHPVERKLDEENNLDSGPRTGMFAGSQTFIVPSEVFHEARHQKRKGAHWSKYIGEEDHWSHIREYARKNPKKAIVLQDENTGAMCYAKYGKGK